MTTDSSFNEIQRLSPDYCRKLIGKLRALISHNTGFFEEVTWIKAMGEVYYPCEGYCVPKEFKLSPIALISISQLEILLGLAKPGETNREMSAEYIQSLIYSAKEFLRIFKEESGPSNEIEDQKSEKNNGINFKLFTEYKGRQFGVDIFRCIVWINNVTFFYRDRVKLYLVDYVKGGDLSKEYLDSCEDFHIVRLLKEFETHGDDESPEYYDNREIMKQIKNIQPYHFPMK